MESKPVWTLINVFVHAPTLPALCAKYAPMAVMMPDEAMPAAIPIFQDDLAVSTAMMPYKSPMIAMTGMVTVFPINIPQSAENMSARARTKGTF